MIAFRNFLPQVRFPDGQIVPAERPWLQDSLAARPRMRATKVVARSPCDRERDELPRAGFRRECGDHVPAGKAVQSVLQVIGYADVAKHFRASPPPTRISLADLARDAGHGYELVFFDLLRAKLREALDSNAEKVEICDAHHCVKLLRSAKNWRTDCRGLLDEIVVFIRDETNVHTNVSASSRCSFHDPFRKDHRAGNPRRYPV